jgi:hypothetical protein
MNTDDNENKPPPQSRGKIDLFSPLELSHETGLPRRAILAAVRAGRLRALRLNARVLLIRGADAAKWLASLATDHPAQLDITRRNSPQVGITNKDASLPSAI